jgi:hypothetical protein
MFYMHYQIFVFNVILCIGFIGHNTEQISTHDKEQDTQDNVSGTVQSDDPAQAPHFWDDCEYINYVQGADSCEMCGEEV